MKPAQLLPDTNLLALYFFYLKHVLPKAAKLYIFISYHPRGRLTRLHLMNENQKEKMEKNLVVF